MKRLSRDEIADLKKRLAEWQTPVTMRDHVGTTMDDLGLKNLFNQSGLEFLRDAWTAAEFGEVRNADRVRLVPDDWPGFELLFDNRVEAFEAVEADEPERQRGVEYRQRVGVVEDDPVEDWIARAEQASAWLEAACRKKVAKRYGPRTNLVIYLNLCEYGVRQSEVEACLRSATEPAKDAFDAVWVLWKEWAYPVWP